MTRPRPTTRSSHDLDSRVLPAGQSSRRRRTAAQPARRRCRTSNALVRPEAACSRTIRSSREHARPARAVRGARRRGGARSRAAGPPRRVRRARQAGGGPAGGPEPRPGPAGRGRDGARVRRTASAVRALARPSRSRAGAAARNPSRRVPPERGRPAGPLHGRPRDARTGGRGGRGRVPRRVVDDGQWLDRVSAQTLAFVARRLMAALRDARPTVAAARGAAGEPVTRCWSARRSVRKISVQPEERP